MGLIVGLVILVLMFWAFSHFVLGPIYMWSKKRQIKAGVHSVGRAPDMNYQARLNAQALADELQRNAAAMPAGAPVLSTNSLDLASQLKNLTDLHQSGALTADEFQASKAKLLDKG
ncbi:MAG TPA: SHOCT domain-containing protein [Solirubrobacteraceae bacterium]|nr:SHOCT domain-containing protein [Solirubrobacteraceae bacterium]